MEKPHREGPPVARLEWPIERRYQGETYYGQPPLKPAPWNWMVSGYIFLAGLAGSAQIIAALARLADPQRSDRLVRNARIIAASGTAVGAVLLLADLRTPQRWYNMLRIYRSTSPMSFGSYILTGFGGFTGITLLGEIFGGPSKSGRIVRVVADVAQISAAVMGAGASTYTASLLSATSTPLWAAAPRHLGVKFGAASIATAAAALSLGERAAGRRQTAARLDDLALLGAAAQLAATLSAKQVWRRKGVAKGVSRTPSGKALDATDLLLVGAVPIAAYAVNRLAGGRAPALSVLAAMALVAGGYASRHAMLRAGMKSAERPKTYFRFAQPEHLPENGGDARLAGRKRRRLR